MELVIPCMNYFDCVGTRPASRSPTRTRGLPIRSKVMCEVTVANHRLTQTEASHKLSQLGWTLLSKYSSYKEPVVVRHTCGVRRTVKFAYVNHKCVCNYVPDEVRVRRIQDTCLRRYGVTNAAKTQEVQSRMRSTCLTRYGVPNAIQSRRIKSKALGTLRQKYGEHVTNLMDIPEIREKALEWLLDEQRLGRSKDKCAETCQTRYGVKSYFQTDSFKKKARSTCRRRYGVSNPMQDRGIFERSTQRGYRTIEYTTSTGAVLGLQGSYEVEVAENLDKQGAPLRVSRIRVRYNFMGKSAVYYPDLDCLCPRTRRPIFLEVKSRYTLMQDLDRNLAKFKAANRFARRHGLTFALVVPTGNGKFHTTVFPTKRKLTRLISSQEESA